MIEIIPNWHPLLVHFTVALFVASWLFYVLGSVAPQSRFADQWRTTARWSLWLGALLTIGTLLAGWDAYNTVTHDTPSHEAMTDHRNWALVTAGLFFVLALWVIARVRGGKNEGVSFLLALTVAVVLLAGTAWRGGELVYRHGLGVLSLPNTGGHDHAEHDHGYDGHADGPSETHVHDADTDHHDVTTEVDPVEDTTARPSPTSPPDDAIDTPPDDGHDHHDHAH